MSKRSLRITLLAAATVAFVTLMGSTQPFACGVLDGWAPVVAPPSVAVPAPPSAGMPPEVATLAVDAVIDPLVAAGGSSCCDPAKEPGTGGNPFCFEGHSCCANGQWQCNNPDATPSCTVCGSSCSPSGAVCTSSASCCSGVCKKGRCR